MIKSVIFLALCSPFVFFAQKEITLSSTLEKATVFFQGAQLEHSKKQSLKPGKQTLVFEKLTDFLDPNTMQVKATGNLTILSVSLRKNYEDKRISNQELRELNAKLDKLYIQDEMLRDEHLILQTDKNLLTMNSQLRGNEKGVVVAELKEAYSFIHARMVEISKRETEIERQLEDLNKQINKIAQEIDAQRSKPVINYSEMIVEVDVAAATEATFSLSYITPNATWTPYYDMRSNGIGMPVKLEAKAFVNQTTGIEWKDIDLVLSTNDPYQNSREIELQPWYLNYNNYPQTAYTQARTIPNFDYSGQKIRGEVIDASTGESMPFAKVYFSSFPNMNVVTDFDGKFEITVPKGEYYLNASYVGYSGVQQYVNAPYIKFFLMPNDLVFERPQSVYDMNTVNGEIMSQDAEYYSGYEESQNVALEEVMVMDTKSIRKKGEKRKSKEELYQTIGGAATEADFAANVATQVVQKDLRVEYQIQSKFSIASDGIDQRVQISTYELPSSYEYHTVPKIDPAVYLVAQVSGWEKLNLLSGESNIYFDGTFIGKSYVDVNSTKDTLSFSMGKDAKLQALRTRITEKSKNRAIGSRQKFEVAWEIKVKNNGGAEIPLLIKDQFPVSTNDDIKVKRGDYSGGKLDDNTGIITWETVLPKNQSKSFTFDYTIDYQKGMILYLE
ncbi:MAG: hypothetical protein K0R65_545 [Crocinitomicaceae bacterium]|jgi:hypothetical protein|nr:hypothetical protein [Crocinitomicaceae bacterium]